MDTTMKTCTGCGASVPETRAVDLGHADTYSGTTWHCRECAAVCDGSDEERRQYEEDQGAAMGPPDEPRASIIGQSRQPRRLPHGYDR